MDKSLKGHVALVTGASRGVGLGIAKSLGRAGATVYVTGRTTLSRPADVPLPGTIEAAAQSVSELGGIGIAIECDHADDTQTRAAVDRILADQGKIDLLVNNAWSGYKGIQRGEDDFEARFWECPDTRWDSMFVVGVRSHFIASSLVARSMVKRRSGLIVNVSYYAGGSYHFNVVYGVAKAAVDRMSCDMARELEGHNVASVSLWPGTVRTEMNLAQPETDLSHTESPEFVGRGVVALATDPDILQRSGQVLETRRLAIEYGFTDFDGLVPPLDRGL